MLIEEIQTLEDISNQLTTRTFIPYQYFVVGTLLLINVSLSEDGAQEYKVFKYDEETKSYYEFNSLTVSWMKEERLVKLLNEYDATPIENIENPWKDVPVKEQPLLIFDEARFAKYKAEFEEFNRNY